MSKTSGHSFMFPVYLFCGLLAGCWMWENRPYKNSHYYAEVSKDPRRKRAAL